MLDAVPGFEHVNFFSIVGRGVRGGWVGVSELGIFGGENTSSARPRSR